MFDIMGLVWYCIIIHHHHPICSSDTFLTHNRQRSAGSGSSQHVPFVRLKIPFSFFFYHLTDVASPLSGATGDSEN